MSHRCDATSSCTSALRPTLGCRTTTSPYDRAEDARPWSRSTPPASMSGSRPSALTIEPDAHCRGVVPKMLADAVRVGASALVAPLVEGRDRDAQELRYVSDGPQGLVGDGRISAHDYEGSMRRRLGGPLRLGRSARLSPIDPGAPSGRQRLVDWPSASGHTSNLRFSHSANLRSSACGHRAGAGRERSEVPVHARWPDAPSRGSRCRGRIGRCGRPGVRGGRWWWRRR